MDRKPQEPNDGAPTSAEALASNAAQRPGPPPLPGGGQPDAGVDDDASNVAAEVQDSELSEVGVRSRRPAATPEPEPRRTPLMIVVAVVFVLGSVGGGLLGLSYARGGFVRQLLNPAQAGPSATAASASSPATTRAAPVFNLDEVPVAADSSPGEPAPSAPGSSR